MSKVNKWLQPQETRIIFSWLLGGLILRGLIAVWLYPGFDEAYYYLYSQHLDWSYFDHPVLVAFTTGFGCWLTGAVSQFTIRLGTLILYTGSLLLLYLTSRKLFNSQSAQLTLAIASIVPIFLIGFGVLTLPDSPLIFFWSASLYCAACEFFPLPDQHHHPAKLKDTIGYYPSYRLVILGILVGLACLSKYHGFVLALGLTGFCLTSSSHRRVFVSPWFWLGLILFVVTLFPLWFWNWQHDWISFRFQLSTRFDSESATSEGFNLINLGVAFLAGVGYLFPTFGLPMWWVSWRFSYSLRKRSANGDAARSLLTQFTRKKNDLVSKQLLILWISLPLTLGFTFLGGFKPVLPTWSQPGFWGLTLLLGYQASLWQQQSSRWVKRWLAGSAIAIISLLLFILLHVATGTLQKQGQYALFGGFIPVKDDPSLELIDIEQLRQGFINSPPLLEALNNSSFIVTNEYYLGGYIAMAIAPLTNIPVTCFSEDMRGFTFWSKSEQWLGEDGIYMTIDKFNQISSLNSIFSHYFANFQPIGTIQIKRGGVVTETFHLYQGHRLLKPFPPLGKQGVL